MSTVSGDLTGRSLITNTKLTRSLGRATQRGVKVYGVVYDDVDLLSSSDSSHTVTALEKVNPDMIKIMRHPDHVDLETILDFKDTLYWSHHDKAVIIDDKVVFWGGLDSCFGRWDYNAHPLADLHSHIRDEVWLGQDYNDARIMDFSHVDKWKYNMLNRTEWCP
jgi:phospholipase D1/2